MYPWLVWDLICMYPAAFFLPLPPECFRIIGSHHKSLLCMILLPSVLGIKFRTLNRVGRC